MNNVRRALISAGAGLLSFGSLVGLHTSLAGASAPIPVDSYDMGDVTASGARRNASCSVTTVFENTGTVPHTVTVNQSIAGLGGWLHAQAGSYTRADVSFGATETSFVIDPGEKFVLAVFDNRVTAPFHFRQDIGPWFVRDIDSNGRCDDGTTTTEAPTSTTEEPTTTTEAPTTTTEPEEPTTTTTEPEPTTTVPEPTTTTAPPVLQTVVCPAGTFVRLTFAIELPAVAVINYNGVTVHISSAIPEWITTLPLSVDVEIEVLTDGVTVDCITMDQATTTSEPTTTSEDPGAPAGFAGNAGPGNGNIPGVSNSELPFTGSNTGATVALGAGVALLGGLLLGAGTRGHRVLDRLNTSRWQRLNNR